MGEVIKGLSAEESDGMHSATAVLKDYASAQPTMHGDQARQAMKTAVEFLPRVEDPTASIDAARTVVMATDLYLPVPESQRPGRNRRENEIYPHDRHEAAEVAIAAWTESIPKLQDPAKIIAAGMDAAKAAKEYVENPFKKDNYKVQALLPAAEQLGNLSPTERAPLLIPIFILNAGGGGIGGDGIWGKVHNTVFNHFERDVNQLPPDALKAMRQQIKDENVAIFLNRDTAKNMGDMIEAALSKAGGSKESGQDATAADGKPSAKGGNPGGNPERRDRAASEDTRFQDRVRDSRAKGTRGIPTP